MTFTKLYTGKQFINNFKIHPMKKKFSFLILLLTTILSVSNINAQVKIGLKGGYLLSQTEFLFEKSNGKTSSSEVDIQSVNSFHATIPIEIPVSKVYSIQPEFSFKKIGNQYDKDYEFFNHNISYVGLGLMNKFTLPSKGMQPYFVGGVQVNKAVNVHSFGRMKVDGASYHTMVNENINAEDVNLKTWDANLRLGFGLMKNVGSTDLLFEANYDRGLMDIDSRADVVAKTGNAFSLQIGIMRSF